MPPPHPLCGFKVSGGKEKEVSLTHLEELMKMDN
jgi:hypothetical protein